MGVEIFLGEPPENIKNWILEHSTPPAPATHADTWYKYDGDTEWRTVSISGMIANDSLPDVGSPDVGNLVTIEIGTDITSIGDGAFFNCIGLTSVTIPNSVTSIGNGVFYGCEGLTSVTIPNSVTRIGTEVFTNCESLTTITVLGKTTAQAQTLLAEAGVPEGCTIIGELG